MGARRCWPSGRTAPVQEAIVAQVAVWFRGVSHPLSRAKAFIAASSPIICLNTFAFTKQTLERVCWLIQRANVPRQGLSGAAAAIPGPSDIVSSRGGLRSNLRSYAELCQDTFGRGTISTRRCRTMRGPAAGGTGIRSIIGRPYQHHDRFTPIDSIEERWPQVHTPIDLLTPYASNTIPYKGRTVRLLLHDPIVDPYFTRMNVGRRDLVFWYEGGRYKARTWRPRTNF